MPSLLSKALKPGQQWSKDELYDTFFVLRMLLAALIGIVIGAIGGHGLQSFLAGLTVHWFASQFWLKYQNIDVSAYDSPSGPVTMEGMFPSVFMFVLTWVVTYTCLTHGGTKTAP